MHELKQSVKKGYPSRPSRGRSTLSSPNKEINWMERQSGDRIARYCEDWFYLLYKWKKRKLNDYEMDVVEEYRTRLHSLCEVIVVRAMALL
jgi:hypothetical protein